MAEICRGAPVHKYDRGLSRFRRHELHWLDADDRVRFRVCVQVYKCLHNMAPGYLSTLCQPVSNVPGRRHLRSARRGELDFPRVNLATYGGRAFAYAYAGPTSWNSLPDSLKDINLTLQTFKRHLKTFLFFLHTSAFSAFQVSYKNALYKSTVIIKGAEPPPNFRPISIVPKRLDASRGRPQPRRVCVRWGPSPSSQKGDGAPSPILRGEVRISKLDRKCGGTSDCS